MRVTLLGTGGSAGVPMIGGPDGRGDWGLCDPAEPRNRRTRASIVIDSGEGDVLLVDTSPDLRGQLLDCGISHVAALLYTHAHADHIVGLDDVRILNRIAERPLEAFGTAATLEEIELRFGYAFLPWQPPGFFRPVMLPRVVAPGDTLETAGMRVGVFEQDHGFTARRGWPWAASGNPPTRWHWMTPPSPRWRGWIPGWSAAFSASRTVPTRGWRACWNGWSGCARAAPC